MISPSTPPRQTVALCSTCLVDQVLPEVGVATVALLRRAGCHVELPAGQTCCGQPFFNSGFRPQARRLARRTIEIFEPFERVVLPSGSCVAMIRVEYPHLLADDEEWRPRAEALAAKTFELGEELAELGWSAPGTVGGGRAPSVTYHDSCHMCRLLGLGSEPRKLLSESGCDLREMDEADRCCGFGGLFSVRLPEIANAMARSKLDAAAATGAALLVTSDPGCLVHLRGLERPGIEARHLAVVLDALDRGEGDAGGGP